MRGPEGFARRAHEVAFERFLRREGNRVQQQIEPVRFASNLAKKICDLFVFRDVTRMKRRPFAEFAHQFFDIFLQSLTLIIEDQFRAGRGPCFGNRPRNAAFVRHPENDTDLACQNLIRHDASPYAPFPPRKTEGKP